METPITKFVKTQKLAGYLMLHGFKFLRKDDDRNKADCYIYIFKNEEGIEEAINRYKVEYGRKEN